MRGPKQMCLEFLLEGVKYDSLKEMWQDLYVDRKMPAHVIGDFLGISDSIILRDVRRVGLPVYKKGHRGGKGCNFRVQEKRLEYLESIRVSSS